MSHLVSDKWFWKTQVIPRFGGNLQECGDFTWKDSVRLESLVCPIFCYSKYHQTRVVIIFFQSSFKDLKSIPLLCEV